MSSASGGWRICQQATTRLDAGDFSGVLAGLHHVDHDGEGHVAVPEGVPVLRRPQEERAHQGVGTGQRQERAGGAAGRGQADRRGAVSRA